MYALAFLGQLSRSYGLAIRDGGDAVFKAESAPIDWRDMPSGQPERVLTLLLNELAAKAGESIETIERGTGACTFAMSGIDDRVDTSRLRQWATDHALCSVEVKIVPLARAGHVGAFLGGPGVLIRCGHGSSVYASDGNGHSALKGGWGGIISDHGSGCWLGRQALVATHRFVDGLAVASEADFVRRLVRICQLAEGPELILQLNQRNEIIHIRKFLNQVGRAVCQLAREDDPYADRLLSRAYSHIITLVKSALSDLTLNSPITVSVRGGIAETQANFVLGLLDRLSREIKELAEMEGRANGSYGPLVGIGLLSLQCETSNAIAVAGAHFLAHAREHRWAYPALTTFPNKVAIPRVEKHDLHGLNSGGHK